MNAQKSFIIGVAGGTGSGKTTVSQRIREAVGPARIAYIQHDSYYYDSSHLSPEERAQKNYDHPESLDTPLLVEHLIQLRNGTSIEVPVYDFAHHERSDQVITIQSERIILVEGILIFSEKTLREQMDMRIFVDTDADLRFIRRMKRDIAERGRTLESVTDQYMSTVRPMHLEFVEPSKRYANIIVPEGYNPVAMDMIVSRINELLTPEN